MTEDSRGGFTVNINSVRHNRKYSYQYNIYVPWTNKELALSFETFRNKLKPGENEEWKIKISDKYGQKILQKWLQHCLILHWRLLRATPFTGIYIHTSIQTSTGRIITLFQLSIPYFLTSAGINIFQDIIRNTTA